MSVNSIISRGGGRGCIVGAQPGLQFHYNRIHSLVVDVSHQSLLGLFNRQPSFVCSSFAYKLYSRVHRQIRFRHQKWIHFLFLSCRTENKKSKQQPASLPYIGMIKPLMNKSIYKYQISFDMFLHFWSWIILLGQRPLRFWLIETLCGGLIWPLNFKFDVEQLHYKHCSNSLIDQGRRVGVGTRDLMLPGCTCFSSTNRPVARFLKFTS